MPTQNQNPEQIARDQIDQRLTEAGWLVQKHEVLDFIAGIGIAVQEYTLSTSELKDTQLVLIDKEFCAPEDRLGVKDRKRHMKPNDPENSPLMPYYRGN